MRSQYHSFFGYSGILFQEVIKQYGANSKNYICTLEEQAPCIAKTDCDPVPTSLGTDSVSTESYCTALHGAVAMMSSALVMWEELKDSHFFQLLGIPFILVKPFGSCRMGEGCRHLRRP